MQVKCTCGKVHRVSAENAGRMAKCGVCGNIFRIPLADDSATIGSHEARKRGPLGGPRSVIAIVVGSLLCLILLLHLARVFVRGDAGVNEQFAADSQETEPENLLPEQAARDEEASQDTDPKSSLPEQASKDEKASQDIQKPGATGRFDRASYIGEWRNGDQSIKLHEDGRYSFFLGMQMAAGHSWSIGDTRDATGCVYLTMFPHSIRCRLTENGRQLMCKTSGSDLVLSRITK